MPILIIFSFKSPKLRTNPVSTGDFGVLLLESGHYVACLCVFWCKAHGENWTRNVYQGTDVQHCFDAV